MKRFRARLLEMADTEILAMIPSDQYLRIKNYDKRPLFRAYVVGHEGESRGDISVDGKNFFGIVKKWYRAAINNLHDKIQYGLKLFHGHDYSESQNVDRPPIGEVVGKSTRKIKELWSEVIVAYIYPKFRNLPLDIASIEADIILTEDGGDYLADVEGVTGIALESSANETPGFPGATVLGFVQEFTRKQLNPPKRRRAKMSLLDDLTLDDVKEYIRAERLGPMDLFPVSRIVREPEVKDIIADAKESARVEHIRRKKAEGKTEDEREDWEKEKGDLQKEIKDLKTTLAKTQVSDLFDTAKTARKLDDKEVAFIQKRLTRFEPQDPEKIKEDFDKFLDQQIDDFQDVQVALGLKEKPDEKGKEDPSKNKSKDSGTGPGEENKEIDSVDDDDFIPGEVPDNP